MPTTPLLICGPSGAGKSTLIHTLSSIDDRFVYVRPYMTRRPRPGETDKVFVLRSALERMDRLGELLAVNRMYGATYATPREPIDRATREGWFPVIDFPVARVPTIARKLGRGVFCVYLTPDSVEVLYSRLADGRDPSGCRLRAALAELRAHDRGRHAEVVDLELVSCVGAVSRNAEAVRLAYLRTGGMPT